jgi:hypothetical protein
MKIMVARYYEIEIPGDPHNHGVSAGQKVLVKHLVERAAAEGTVINFDNTFFKRICEYLIEEHDQGRAVGGFSCVQNGSRGVDMSTPDQWELWG